MKKIINGENGHVIFSVALFTSILLVFLIFFVIVISKSNFNLLIHETKSDLYLIARNVVFAIQRDLMAEDIESVDYDKMLEMMENGMKETWSLDRKLKNGKGVIKEAKIEQLMFLETYDRDPTTGRLVTGFSLHTVAKVKFTPVLLAGILDDKFEFSIHEDIVIHKMELEEGE